MYERLFRSTSRSQIIRRVFDSSSCRTRAGKRLEFRVLIAVCFAVLADGETGVSIP